MIYIIDRHAYVASVHKQDKTTLNYRKEEPWLLLYRLGRVERFATQRDALIEARKSWPECSISRD